MNLYLTPQNIALSVVYLRNSRAITCDIRLDGEIFEAQSTSPRVNKHFPGITRLS